jgi:hypothetical protein
VQLVTRRRSAAAMVLVGALALTACDAGGASHVVGQAPASAVPAATGTSNPSSPAPSSATPASPPASAGSPVGSPTLSQVDAELGALDNSLNQANTDVNNPQGDS